MRLVSGPRDHSVLNDLKPCGEDRLVGGRSGEDLEKEQGYLVRLERRLGGGLGEEVREEGESRRLKVRVGRQGEEDREERSDLLQKRRGVREGRRKR